MSLALIYVQYLEMHTAVSPQLSWDARMYVQLQVPSEEVEANTYVLSFMIKIVGKHFQIFLPHMACLMSAISRSWGIAVLIIISIPMST